MSGLTFSFNIWEQLSLWVLTDRWTNFLDKQKNRADGNSNLNLFRAVT
jgi:hypothetical protein